ncbi:MAG: hypothetical protein HYW90_04240 [Candidatus Sungbacteria bacterium]|nr:hypothetical protein [Candidatus Sungbacteria bacterium]
MKTIIVFGFVAFVVIVVLVVLLPFFFGVELAGVGEQSRSGRGVFSSHDAGLAWEQRNSIRNSRSTLAGLTVTDLVIDPRDSARLYIGTGDSGIWKSEDSGKEWEKVVDEAGVLDSAAKVLRIAISKRHEGLWYVAAYQKNRGVLLKSEDGGRNFREVYFVPVERFGVFDVWIDDAAETVFVATGQGGVLESGDGGKSWRVMKWFADGLVRLTVDERTRNFYVLTSRGRMYKSSDRGQNWTELTQNFNSFNGSSRNQNLVIDQRAGILYLASDYGLIRSYDGGLSWVRVPIIIPPEALPVLSVVISPADSRVFYISAQAQLYKTVDAGLTWSAVAIPSVRRVTKIVVDERDPAVMYLVSNN